MQQALLDLLMRFSTIAGVNIKAFHVLDLPFLLLCVVFPFVCLGDARRYGLASGKEQCIL
jgi:hypothetical protein